jgi:peptidoglycan L-alanyl-D-glutamate endopeptidase CwlK
MASRKLTDCDYRLQRAYTLAAHEFRALYPNEPQPFLTCTFRSNEEQAQLYAKGRTAPGNKVTNIKTGGKHNVKPAQAFDIAFKDSEGVLDWSPELFAKFAAIIKANFNGLIKWGGDWKRFQDRPHFEI